jgi:hypothetical protein
MELFLLWSFSVCSLLVYNRFLLLDFVSCYFAEAVYGVQEFFGSLSVTSCHLWTGSLTSLPIHILLFLLTVLLLWQGIPIVCLIGVERLGTLVSFLTLGKMVSCFPVTYDIGYRFVIYILYYVEVHSFYS